MLGISRFIFAFFMFTFANSVFAVDYVDSEYVIPEGETPGVIGNRCEESYVPVHSRELLQRVQHWALGIALARYSNLAGYHFDRELYDQDVPHRGLFNFGFATVTNCLEVDVISKAVGLNHQLRFLALSLAEEDAESAPERFREFYSELAEELGFSKYLSDLQED